MKEPTILLALDGGESGSSSQPPTTSEPKALFFVLFGLVYETLVNTSADATSSATSRENAIIALQALKSLVQPQYSGRAILEPTTLTEFTSLCYRMAITETANVQLHLVEVIVSFAETQKSNIRATHL